MIGHTPGPWVANQIEHDDSIRIEQPMGGYVVAMTTWQGDPSVERANANIIAAAPDLLAACKTALDWLADHGSDVTAPIAAAIAKAEGTK